MCFINVASFINSPFAPFAVSISLPLPSVSYGYQMIMSCRLLGVGGESSDGNTKIIQMTKIEKENLHNKLPAIGSVLAPHNVRCLWGE